MSLQRTLQNGREGLLGANKLGPPQVGHETVGGVLGAVFSLMRCSLTQGCSYAHKVSSKAAFSVSQLQAAVFVGRTRRTDTIKRLALISGIRPESAWMRRRSSW